MEIVKENVNSIIAYTSINYTSRALHYCNYIRMNMNTIYVRETRVPALLVDRATICFRAANLRNNADPSFRRIIIPRVRKRIPPRYSASTSFE